MKTLQVNHKQMYCYSLKHLIYYTGQKYERNTFVFAPIFHEMNSMILNILHTHTHTYVVVCGLWNVGPLLFNGCAKFLDIGTNWNTLSSMCRIQSIPSMPNGWHVRWVCWPCKNWDVSSFQELCTDPCHMGPLIIMPQHEVMVQQWAIKMPSTKCTCVLCP